MNQNDTYKCIKQRTLKPECARPRTKTTKNNKKIYASSGYFTVDQAIFWSPPSSFSCLLMCHFAVRVYTKSFRGLSQFDIKCPQPNLGTSMQILRQTVDLVSLYTLPVDPHRGPLRLTRPRRPHPHGRVDFVVLFFVDFLGRYSCRQRPC